MELLLNRDNEFYYLGNLKAFHPAILFIYFFLLTLQTVFLIDFHM